MESFGSLLSARSIVYLQLMFAEFTLLWLSGIEDPNNACLDFA